MTRSRISEAVDRGFWTPPATGKLALYRPRADSDLTPFPGERARAWVSWAPDATALAAQGVALAGAQEDGFTAAAVFITRSRAESLGLIAEALTCSSAGSSVLIDGQRGDGIDGIWRACRTAFGDLASVTQGHGRAFALPRPDPMPQAVAAWAAAAAPRRLPSGWVTRPGVFSADGPDAGSVLLGDMLGPGLGARVADLGAGWGYLAARALAADARIERLDLIEAHAHALDCARVNAADPRACFVWADATTWAPGPIYDSIVMNPPFHAGRSGEPALGQAFIARAAAALRPNGRLLMVANRHLPYEAALEAAFGAIETRATQAGFKLIVAARPRTRRPERLGYRAAAGRRQP